MNDKELFGDKVECLRKAFHRGQNDGRLDMFLCLALVVLVSISYFVGCGLPDEDYDSMRGEYSYRIVVRGEDYSNSFGVHPINRPMLYPYRVVDVLRLSFDGYRCRDNELVGAIFHFTGSNHAINNGTSPEESFWMEDNDTHRWVIFVIKDVDEYGNGGVVEYINPDFETLLVGDYRVEFIYFNIHYQCFSQEIWEEVSV